VAAYRYKSKTIITNTLVFVYIVDKSRLHLLAFICLFKKFPKKNQSTSIATSNLLLLTLAEIYIRLNLAFLRMKHT